MADRIDYGLMTTRLEKKVPYIERGINKDHDISRPSFLVKGYKDPFDRSSESKNRPRAIGFVFMDRDCKLAPPLSLGCLSRFSSTPPILQEVLPQP